MDLGVLRDLVIVIGGFLLLFIVIVAGILGFLFYRQISNLTKNIKETVNAAKELGPNVKQAMSFFAMIKDTINGKKTSEESKPAGSKAT